MSQVKAGKAAKDEEFGSKVQRTTVPRRYRNSLCEIMCMVEAGWSDLKRNHRKRTYMDRTELRT